MNTPNPLVPQGTFADKGKSHVRITVFAILAVHVVLLGVLLIAGCDKKPTTDVPPADPGLPSAGSQPPLDPAWPGPSAAAPTSNIAPLTGTGAPPVAAGGLSNPSPTSLISPVDPTPPPPPATAHTEHVVVKGDSFYTLGKKYNVSTKAIANENPGVDSSKLKLGQKLKIPAPKPATTSASAGAVAPSDAVEKTYTVKSGDNLTKIAKVTGVSIRELRAANSLRTDQLKVGQKLKIPSKASTPVEAPPPPLPEAAPLGGVAPPIR